jgi:hypothetical protein
MFGHEKQKIHCFWHDENNNDNSNTNNTNRKVTRTIMERGKEKELFNEKDEKYMKMTTLLITRANNNDIILKYSSNGGQDVSVQEILYANTISKVVIEVAHDLGGYNKK